MVVVVVPVGLIVDSCDTGMDRQLIETFSVPSDQY